MYFFSWSVCLLNMFHRWYSLSIFIFPVCWHNRHHSSWPFLECRPSKLHFKILWKHDDWSFRFHHFLENGWFYRENTYECSPLVTKWQIIWHFHCCLNNIPLTSWGNEMIFTNLNDQSSYFQSILKRNLLVLHSRKGHDLWWVLFDDYINKPER
jgi:hypothetical protein